MASQGFFSGSESAEKRRFAGEKENNAVFDVKVKPVMIANINKYNQQTPSLDYAPDSVEQYIKESETKSYKPEKKDSYVSADSYKPDVKTFSELYRSDAYKKQVEKREQVYSSINKDLNVGPLGDANLPSGFETKLIGNKYKIVKDGKELTRQE